MIVVWGEGRWSQKAVRHTRGQSNHLHIAVVDLSTVRKLCANEEFWITEPKSFHATTFAAGSVPTTFVTYTSFSEQWDDELVVFAVASNGSV